MHGATRLTPNKKKSLNLDHIVLPQFRSCTGWVAAEHLASKRHGHMALAKGVRTNFKVHIIMK